MPTPSPQEECEEVDEDACTRDTSSSKTSFLDTLNCMTKVNFIMEPFSLRTNIADDNCWEWDDKVEELRSRVKAKDNEIITSQGMLKEVEENLHIKHSELNKVNKEKDTLMQDMEKQKNSRVRGG